MPETVSPAPTAATPASPKTVAEFQDALTSEWGTYVAIVPIDLNGARAANPGDPIPASHVKQGLVSEEQVAKRSTKAGRAAAGLPDDESKG